MSQYVIKCNKGRVRTWNLHPADKMDIQSLFLLETKAFDEKHHEY